MAKIKVRGMFEMVSGPDSEALAIREGLDNKTIQPDEWVSFGSWSGKARDIGGIVVEQTAYPDSGFSERLAEEDAKRREILALSPRQRAERCSWGAFSLFYYGIKQTRPDISLKPAVIDAAEQWFKEHPRWTVPSVRAWYALMGIDGEYSMSAPALRILERVEANQFEQIKYEAVQVVA